jgi:hypothetical protein
MKKIFVMFLAMFLLAMGCKTDTSNDPISAKQLEIFSLLPGETQFIMYMNLNALRGTEFWENYFKGSLEGNSGNDWLSKFESETGVGLKKGVSEIYTTSSWKGNNTIVVQFDRNLSKVKNYFKNSGYFIKENLAGSEVFRQHGNNNSIFYFTGGSTLLIAADKKYLENVINGKNNSISENKSLIDLITLIKNKNQYWMAANQGSYAAILLEKLPAVNGNTAMRDMLKSIKQVTLSAEFDDGVILESIWGCKDQKDAYLLSTAIKSALALNLLSERDYALGQLLKDLKIKRDDERVNFLLSLDHDDIQKLKNIARENNLEKKL